MPSSQAIVSVVTDSDWLRLYKPADLLSHREEEHLHPSSSVSSPVCPGGTTSPRPRLTEACRAVIGQEDLWNTDDGGQRSATVTPSHLRTS